MEKGFSNLGKIQNSEGPLEAPSEPFSRRKSPRILTAREVEVLRLLAGGKTNREIAVELGVSIGTAERHVANIYSKAKTRNRAEAAVYAFKHCLI